MKDSTPRLALSPTEKEARASFQDVCFYPTGDLLSAEIDFVFIIDIDLVEEAAAEIIKAFDSLITGCYDREDSTQGFIESFDRKGKASHFSVMGISIGIAEARSHHFSHYGEVTELASEMKKFAKQFKGSCFQSDRRQDKEAGKQKKKPTFPKD